MKSNTSIKKARNPFAIAGLALAIGAITMFAADRLLLLFSKFSIGLPSQSPVSRVNAHGSNVYKALAEPSITIPSDQIDVLKLPKNGAIENVDPFRQLLALGDATWFRVLGIAILTILTVILLLNLVPRVANRRPTLLFVGLATWSSLTAGFAILAYVTRGARATWDEIYVFASQARNFAQTGIAAVPVTGSRGLAESSADLGITIGAGVLLKAFPFLHAESALVLCDAILLSALTLGAILALRYWFLLGRLASIAVGITLIALLPQAILSTAQAVPTGVAAGALALFALVMLHAVKSDRTLAFAIYSVPFAIIRWEYGLVTLLASAILFGNHLYRVRKGTSEGWRTMQFALLGVPWLYFSAASIARLALFSSFIPSGILFKSMGLDGAYLSSGLDYVRATTWTNYWPLVLALAISLVVLSLRLQKSANYLLVVAVLLLPLLDSVLAGGDWFPLEWQRYVLPTYSAVLIVTFAAMGETLFRRERLRFVLVPLVAAYLVTQFNAFLIMRTDYLAPDPPGRTNCLARAGMAIARVVPPSSGVASAEVNTVAFFAKAPLTDLIGIVDPRVAGSPPSPRTPGDLLHRKSLPADIYSDRPGAIYLFEGASCPGSYGSDYSDTEAWNELLGSDITKYRVGNVSSLLADYKPVTIIVEGEVLVRTLVRKDLVPAYAH